MDHIKHYFVSKNLICEFANVALSNFDEHGNHVETLALLIGFENCNGFYSTELIFPTQKGTSFDVEDTGKLTSLC